jgi:hypothetical protein
MNNDGPGTNPRRRRRSARTSASSRQCGLRGYEGRVGVTNAGNACVVEEHVDPAELLHDGRDERRGLVTVGDVDPMRDAGGVAVDVDGDDLRTLSGEQLGARPAASRAGAGDDAHLAGEPHS